MPHSSFPDAVVLTGGEELLLVDVLLLLLLLLGPLSPAHPALSHLFTNHIFICIIGLYRRYYELLDYYY